MVTYPAGLEGAIRLVPNRSLSVAGAWRVWLIIAGATLALSGAVAALGYWPPLPWAGLEAAVLGIALWLVQSKLARSQVLIVEEGNLRVLFLDGETKVREESFHPAWVRVVYRPQPARRGLFLSSHGRSTEIGDFLAAAEKRDLAHRLPDWIAHHSDSRSAEAL